MTDDQDFDTVELTSSETQTVDSIKSVLNQKQIELQSVQTQLSQTIEQLCEKHEVDVSRVKGVRNGMLLLEKENDSQEG
jgi:hypothetical protein